VRTLRQLRASIGTLMRARRNRTDLVRALVRRPQLLLGTAVYETAIGLSARVEPRLKLLAELEVAALVACEYCLDIGSALARRLGVTEAQLRELHVYRSSDAFDETERLVIELAEAMTRSPAVVPEELRRRLEAAFARAQLTELAAVIAWENQRARLNQGLGVRPSGFSDGEFCLRPEPLVNPAQGLGERTS
jgi:AhpD family alkylhydroperoxidase